MDDPVEFIRAPSVVVPEVEPSRVVTPELRGRCKHKQGWYCKSSRVRQSGEPDSGMCLSCDAFKRIKEKLVRQSTPRSATGAFSALSLDDDDDYEGASSGHNIRWMASGASFESMSRGEESVFNREVDAAIPPQLRTNDETRAALHRAAQTARQRIRPSAAPATAGGPNLRQMFNIADERGMSVHFVTESDENGVLHERLFNVEAGTGRRILLSDHAVGSHETYMYNPPLILGPNDSMEVQARVVRSALGDSPELVVRRVTGKEVTTGTDLSNVTATVSGPGMPEKKKKKPGVISKVMHALRVTYSDE